MEEWTVNLEYYNDKVARKEEAYLFGILDSVGLALKACETNTRCLPGKMLPEFLRSEGLERIGAAGFERLFEQILRLIGEIEAVAVRCLGQTICMGEAFLRGVFLKTDHTMLVTDVSGWRFAEERECYVQAAAVFLELIKELEQENDRKKDVTRTEVPDWICFQGGSFCGLDRTDFRQQMHKKAMELEQHRRQREIMSAMTAVLMCGGKSSRMDHVPKQFLKIGRFTFLEHIYHQLGDFGQVALSCNGEMPGYTVWRDIFPDRGPIGGIHASLLQAAYPAVFFVACDTPGLTRDCIGYLSGNLQEEDDCLVPVCNGREHPMCAIYRTRILPVVEEQIRREDHRLRDLLRQVQTHYLEMPEIYTNDFFNVNTPQMLEKQREKWMKKNDFSPVTYIRNDKKEAACSHLIDIF